MPFLDADLPAVLLSRTTLPSLADSTPVADMAANAPAPDDLARAEKFTREPFVAEGEDVAVALSPGSPR